MPDKEVQFSINPFMHHRSYLKELLIRSPENRLNAGKSTTCDEIHKKSNGFHSRIKPWYGRKRHFLV